MSTSLGTWRFLKDHYAGGVYIQAGEIHEMFVPWTPTADVEPLDQTSLMVFYNAGPKLGGVWRTVRTDTMITAPVTYWVAVAPGVWGLTGLGGGGSSGGGFSNGFSNGFDIGSSSALSPIAAQLARIEDKEV